MRIEGLRSRSGGILVALVFALSFGGVGAFTSWVVGATLWGAWEARGWARVPAEVLHYENGHVQYRYEMNERTFIGHRIGIAAIDTDEGNPAAGSRIQQALNDKQPLEVLVDPDEPSRSVVDTTIPWTMVIGFLPFALGFGAVGLGALAVLVSMMLPESEPDEDEGISSDAASSFFGLALFTFLWNALAFPIAAVMVVELWRSGEWLGLLVLLFPAIGVLMIWGTLVSGLNWVRRRGAVLHPQQKPPRLGGAFSGHVSFPRGVTPGEVFKVVVSCGASGGKGSAPVTHHRSEKQARVADVGGRHRLTFGFDLPDRLEGFARDAETSWQLDLIPEGKQAATFSFLFKVQPPAGVEHLPEEELRPSAGMLDDDEDSPVPAGIPRGLEGIANAIGREKIQEKLDDMPAAQRAKFHAHFDNLPPGQKAAIDKIGKYAHHWPLVKKLLIAAVVLFFLIQMIGVAALFLTAD